MDSSESENKARRRSGRRAFGVLGKQHPTEPQTYRDKASGPLRKEEGLSKEFWEEQRPPHWG